MNKITLHRRTRRGGFADEGDQVVSDGAEGVKVVHDKDVPLARLAANVLQFNEVHVGNANHKDTVTWR